MCSCTPDGWCVSDLRNPVNQGKHAVKDPLNPSQWPWEFNLEIVTYNKHITHQREASSYQLEFMLQS